MWQFDIDDILRVAEQRNVEELKNSATDQLLSQFKVSFCLLISPLKDNMFTVSGLGFLQTKKSLQGKVSELMNSLERSGICIGPESCIS